MAAPVLVKERASDGILTASPIDDPCQTSDGTDAGNVVANSPGVIGLRRATSSCQR